MKEDNLKKLLKNIDLSDYKKGLSFPKEYVTLINNISSGNIKNLSFSVESEHTYQTYRVKIMVSNCVIIGTFCTCLKYKESHTCKHVASCFINFEDIIFKETKPANINDLSLKLLDKFYKINTNVKPKELLTLDVELDLNDSYNYGAFISIKIGKERMYSLRPKIADFLRAYENTNEKIIFGKQFTYDPLTSYFNDSDKNILDWLLDYNEKHNLSNGGMIYVAERFLEKFLNLLKNKTFYFNPFITINKINEEFPFSLSLSKENVTFFLDFNIDKKNLKLLTKNASYIVYLDKAYKLDKNKSNLLKSILDSNLDKLVFEEDKLPYFSKSILPIIKDNIIIDKKIEDHVIIYKAVPKIYFDLDKDKITCSIDFIYKNITVNYFNNTNTNVLRDIEFEQIVLNDILNYGFILNKGKIELETTDLIGEFLETGLIELTSKYETFTTQKLDNIKKVDKVHVSSNFSIGQDNIFNYSFKLNNISNRELDKIFDNLEKRKKYYRLKSGSIINLNESNDLNELKSLMNDLDLKSEDLYTEGVLPKYRALYLDSLKNNKYSIINTNNIFDEFISNFKINKNYKLIFTKEESDILRDYQEEGIRWLYNIHKCDFGGILADEMGLGKSVQALYFLDRILKDDKNSKFLIVVPTSLVYNWENEILKFTPHLKYLILIGNKKEREEKFKDIIHTNILITTYGLLREDKDEYLKNNYKVFIIDEAQNIKNDNALTTKVVKTIKATTKIALTGTPIENSTLELWSIFDFIMPGFLSNISKFHSKYKFNEFNEETNILLKGLNSLISPFILRRKKADVLTELPEKLENNIFLDLDNEQKKVYAAELKNVKEKMNNIIDNEGINKARFMILQLLTKLRQICIDPHIVFENYKGESNKLNVLLQVVEESVKNNHKILIFTSFKTALEIVREQLNKINISNYTIDGTVSSKKRMDLVNNFNKDNTNVFLIMLKSGGTGLNLTSADVVIHLDMWWNPQSENQATDRTHRIGQKKVVEVIKLICKGTIEEKILELQQKKKILSDKLIEGDNRDKNNLSLLSEKDIKNLLSFENKDEE